MSIIDYQPSLFIPEEIRNVFLLSTFIKFRRSRSSKDFITRIWFNVRSRIRLAFIILIAFFWLVTTHYWALSKTNILVLEHFFYFLNFVFFLNLFELFIESKRTRKRGWFLRCWLFVLDTENVVIRISGAWLITFIFR